MGGNKKIYISNIAFPTVVARVTQFGMYVVTQAFIGHLGELNLAAYAHIQIITVRFVSGIVVRFFIFLFFFFFSESLIFMVLYALKEKCYLVAHYTIHLLLRK
jgi:hypothetical protein